MSGKKSSAIFANINLALSGSLTGILNSSGAHPIANPLESSGSSIKVTNVSSGPLSPGPQMVESSNPLTLSNKMVTGQGYEKFSYGKVPSAELIDRVGPPVNSRIEKAAVTFYGTPEVRRLHALGESPSPSLGMPIFKGVILYDGDSSALIEFFGVRIPLFGKAAGELIHLQEIGDPSQYDDLYERFRTEKLCKFDEKSRHLYRKEIKKIGSEKLFILKETERYIEKNKIDRHLLPCIVFNTTPPWQEPAIFHIEPKWYGHPQAADAFSKLFQQQLRRLQEEGFAKAGMSSEELMKALSLRLREFENTLDSAIKDALIGLDPTVENDCYCKAYTSEPKHCRYLTKIEYQSLNYDLPNSLFVDGLTRKYVRCWGKPGSHGGSDNGELTENEMKLLLKMIERNEFLSAWDMQKITGNLSADAALQMFKRMREKIDRKIAQNAPRFFKCYRSLSAEGSRYKFDPPEDYNYLIIANR